MVGKFRNNGQVCISPSRFFVHKDIEKKFTEVAVAEAKNLKIGNGLDEGVVVGPMFEKKAMENTHALIDDAKGKGAQVLTGGKKSERVLQGLLLRADRAQGTLARREDADRGAVRAGDAGARLHQARRRDRRGEQHASTAWPPTCSPTTSPSMWRMAEGLEAGIIGVNDPVPATPQCPFGGMKESGLGRELAHEGLEAYLETKYVSMGLRGS